MRARSFDITPVSDLPYLNGYWGFRLCSISGFCKLKVSGRWSLPCDARVSARVHGASFGDREIQRGTDRQTDRQTETEREDLVGVITRGITQWICTQSLSHRRQTPLPSDDGSGKQWKRRPVADRMQLDSFLIAVGKYRLQLMASSCLVAVFGTCKYHV